MGDRFKDIKPVIRKRDNNITIGSPSQTTNIQGSFKVQGTFFVTDPAVSVPTFGMGQRMKCFGLGPHGIGWHSMSPQTIQVLDQGSGTDYVFVQSTRGFPEKSEWVLNPGGSNMESGKVVFKLDSKLFISGSGINSGLYYDHKKGERLISITYTL
jgi:hypothetical protein